MQRLNVTGVSVWVKKSDTTSVPTTQEIHGRSLVRLINAALFLAVEKEKVPYSINVSWYLAAKELFQNIVDPKLRIDL